MENIDDEDVSEQKTFVIRGIPFAYIVKPTKDPLFVGDGARHLKHLREMCKYFEDIWFCRDAKATVKRVATLSDELTTLRLCHDANHWERVPPAINRCYRIVKARSVLEDNLTEPILRKALASPRTRMSEEEKEVCRSKRSAAISARNDLLQWLYAERALPDVSEDAEKAPPEN